MQEEEKRSEKLVKSNHDYCWGAYKGNKIKICFFFTKKNIKYLGKCLEFLDEICWQSIDELYVS